jgi:hypothetical protein
MTSASPRQALIQTPDVVIELQRAEDGLPLLTSIQRSGDLQGFFDEINIKRPDLSRVFPDEVIDMLRGSLSDRKRIHNVSMPDGTKEQMYVSKTNVGDLFRSLFATVLGRCRTQKMSATDYGVEESGEASAGITYYPPQRDLLLSQGGQLTEGLNRFLGISLNAQQLHSVGIKDGQWVEWHPFIEESIRENFQEVSFRLDTEPDIWGELDDLPERLLDHFIRLPNQKYMREKVLFRVSRHAISQICLRLVGSCSPLPLRKERCSR